MKRRVTIARSPHHDPEIVFRTQPTTVSIRRRGILVMGRSSAQEQVASTLVLTTHYMDEA